MIKAANHCLTGLGRHNKMKVSELIALLQTFPDTEIYTSDEVTTYHLELNDVKLTRTVYGSKTEDHDVVYIGVW